VTFRLRDLASGTLSLSAGRAIAFAASFFIPVALARVFAPADFGTYKQIFLLQATLFGIAQIGMAESLFYFVPADRRRSGRFVANAMIALAVSGLVTAGLITLAGPSIAAWFDNPSLLRYLPMVAISCCLLLIAAPLEIVLTARHRYVGAAAAYAASDLVKAALLILPGILTRDLFWMMVGTVTFAAMRVATLLLVARAEFGRALVPERSLAREQAAYVVPFAGYVLVDILQGSVHQFAVSAWTDPATFAIYAVGCLYVPVTELIAGPAGNVMMVGLRGAAAAPDRALRLWRETTVRIALIVIPIIALLAVLATDVITLLFTGTYAGSVPIFRVYLLVPVLAILQTDAVLRALAETRFLLLLALVKLIIVVATIGPLLALAGLPGAALSPVLALAVGKLVGLARIARAFSWRPRHLLPWRELSEIGAASAAAALLAWIVKQALDTGAPVEAAAALAVFAVVYGIFLVLVRTTRRDASCAASPAS
jgi:O-antigen/teichoic acid export membrane protein